MRNDFSIGDRYELGGLLGSGGMGSVYRAFDKELDREVAIKVLGRHHAQATEFVERFEREVRNVASLDHPNIIRVLGSGKSDDGTPYMAMELAEGGTLKDRIRAAGPLPPREAAHVALQAAGALGAAHDAGIVHRDVKPENVLLTRDGQVKVADFGIARATEATAMTHTSMILGTAPYLSPEQARGETVGPASDLYSLGVVLYEALTGRTPFGTGEHVNPLAIAMKHCTEPAPSPRASNSQVPRPLEIITLTLMRKQPADRYASAAALADDLENFLRGEDLTSLAAIRLAGSSEGAGTQVLHRTPAPPKRRRRKAVPLMAVAVACVLALAFSPLVSMQRPVAFVEGTVTSDAGTLNRASSPTLLTHPGAPETPEKKEAARPDERTPAKAPPSEPPSETPVETNAGSASAPAQDPDQASGSASASAPASGSAPSSSAPASPAPASPAPGESSTPAEGSAPAESSVPAAEEVPASEPTAPPSPEDGEVEVPEVKIPEVEVPDF